MFILKKDSLLFIFFVLIHLVSFSQKQSYFWYFGNKAGLNFNQTPPQVLTNAKVGSIEGCASISDANGNLLFYTNGLSVVNRDHEIMVNGNGLLGDLSSTNNVVIVPLPGSDSIYYLFTIGATGQALKGFRYSIVNMKLQNGLGEVTAKNLLLDDECFEKLAAVRHCNKKDVWITVRKWNTDQYFTYLVTASGINSTPVVSSTGLVISGLPNNALGTLKFSANGKKFVGVHSFENDVVELMDFDNLTGQLLNPILLKPNVVPVFGSFSGVYGAEFSPDGKLLYISSNNNNTNAASVLYQLDITSMNAATILASKQTLSQTGPWYGGALQAGPDGKIYYAMWKDTSVSVIENPNVYGTGCNYNYNKIFIAGLTEPVQFGLPGFVASDLDTLYTAFDFYRSGSCASTAVNFRLNRTVGVDSVRWFFGDAQESNSINPVHTYAAGGTYNVSVIIYKQDCGAASETITHSVSVALSIGSFLQNDTSLCQIKSLNINALITANQFLWNTGQTSPSIQVNTPGLYWLEIAKDGCSFRDSVQVSLKTPAFVNLGADTLVCINKPVKLEASAIGINSYLWSTGSTTKNIDVSIPGEFWVKVTNIDGCTASDTVTTRWGDCEAYIPSAFSPNGDGLNETFGLVNGISSTIFKLYIYNRYGQVIFTSTDSFARWDGKSKGKPAPVGAYPWMITFKNKDGFIQTNKGMVMLIR